MSPKHKFLLGEEKKMSDTEVSKLSIIIRMFLHWCTSYRCISSHASSFVLVKLNCSQILTKVCLFRRSSCQEFKIVCYPI